MRRHERTADDGRVVRAAMAALEPRGRTSRIPDAVRAEVVAYARRERARGRSWHRIARAVGVSAGSLQNWSRSAPPARRLVPVMVTAPPERPGPAAAFVVVSPRGYRVERLDLATATALLRALG